MDRRTVKRERIVWGILGALFLIAACFGAAEFLATRLPGEYAVVRGVLTELTAGKEIEVFVDPYDEAAAPAVHDGCYRIVVCDGPVPSAVPA